MNRVIGAALLSLRAFSCPVRLGSHLSGELGTLQQKQNPPPFKEMPSGVLSSRSGSNVSRSMNFRVQCSGTPSGPASFLHSGAEDSNSHVIRLDPFGAVDFSRD